MADELTLEQKAQVEVMRDRWVERGLRTGPLDKEALREAINEAYACAGFAPPDDIEYCSSPFAGAKRAAELQGKKGVDTAGALWGQHDAGWLAWAEFWDEVMHADGSEKTRGLRAVGRQASWWWAFDTLALVCERPTRIKIDDRYRLHALDGKAIEYPDGWGFFAIHGVTVDGKIVEHPELLTLDDLLRERNAEVARVIVDQMGGWEKILELGSFTVRDQDVDIHGKERYLYEIPMESLDTPMVAVRVVDPSTDRQYLLAVPPEMDTVTKAISWGFSRGAIKFDREQ